MNMQQNLSTKRLDQMRETAITRREAVRRAVFGAAGLWLGEHLGLSAFAAPPAPRAKARSVIQVWMWGGPSHLDTWDPKPDAGYDYYGAFKTPIATNVDGLRVSELMPELAKHADKYAVIRSMTHGVNAHETASYLVQTARQQGGRDVYPCAGAVVSLFKGVYGGYRGLLPPYIVLTEPQGRFDEAGFLGSRFKPFSTGGDPGAQRFAVEGITAPGISDKRQQDRRNYLHSLNTLQHAAPNDPQMRAADQVEKQAYDLILGDAGKVFDLSLEKSEVRDRYGRNTFGQSCLVARKLVERGVPYVTINYQGWDTHKQHFQTIRRKLPEMDRGVATLLQDLSDRGLLASTIIWWSGEFGRTPRVQWEAPWNGGRGHWGNCFSAMVAGGGFKGGRVVGASDAKGEEVKERPVHPADLIGTMYGLLGIDCNARLPHPTGQFTTVLPNAGEDTKSGGQLKEIV